MHPRSQEGVDFLRNSPLRLRSGHASRRRRRPTAPQGERKKSFEVNANTARAEEAPHLRGRLEACPEALSLSKGRRALFASFSAPSQGKGQTVPASRRRGWAIALVMVATAGTAPATRGAVSSTHPAAIVVYPYVAADTSRGTDVLLQLTNASADAVDVRCLYDDSTLTCVGGRSGETCYPDPPGDCSGTCIIGGTGRDFSFRLTAQQPIAWYASRGLDEIPSDRFESAIEIDGDGSKIPPLAEDPFTGVLRCITVDATGAPTDRNVLIGAATLELFRIFPAPALDAAQYNAIGIPAIDGAVNDDRYLVLGGPDGEYSACPRVSVLQHFTDGAILPFDSEADGPVARTLWTTLVLVPCARDSTGAEAGLEVSFTTFNEFEERFETSRIIHVQEARRLSTIDTTTSDRSIFSAAVQGTLTAQTRMEHPTGGDGTGILAIAIELHEVVGDSAGSSSAAFNAHLSGERSEADVIDLPPTPRPTRCAGDCNGDGVVGIDELIRGVNMALGNIATVECPAFDGNEDGNVKIDELIAAVNNALAGCPSQL